MRSRLFTLAFIFLFAGITAACVHIDADISLTMEGCSARIASDIVDNISKERHAARVLVATPVDAVTLRAGRLGMSMQELLTDAMVASGMKVIDAGLRKKPIIRKNSGIVYLSRDKNELKKELSKVDTVLVTTYVICRRKVIFTSRLVDLKTGGIIASGTRSVYRSYSVDSLINDKKSIEKKFYEN